MLSSFVSGRIGAHPEVDVAVAIGSDRRAGNGDAEPPRQSRQRRNLRHRQQAAFAATGARVQLGQERIGRDQPTLGVDAAGYRPFAFERGAHAAPVAAERARVESRATLAR